MTYDINYISLQLPSQDDSTAWIAILISLIALGASIWQAHLSRAHNRLSVKPVLVGHSSDHEGVYSLRVTNEGLGPAIITDARVYRQGAMLDEKGPALVRKAFRGIGACQLEAHEFFFTPYVLPAGASINVFKVRYSPLIVDIEAFLGGMLFLQIEYESAYKEKCPIYESRRPG